MTAEEIRDSAKRMGKWIDSSTTNEDLTNRALIAIHEVLAEIAAQLAELNAKKFINQE